MAELQDLEEHFDVVAKLGEGGFGTVYRGKRKSDGLPVSIKIPRADMVRQMTPRIAREARMMHAIQHPNLARFQGVFSTSDGRVAMAYELADGPAIEELIAQGIPPIQTAVDWIVGMSKGLTALHHAGLIHRDLSPANVYLVGGSRIVITDFGLTKRVGEERPEETGMVIGTPEYMPPEQIAGRPIDTRADVYSLACLSYRLIVGRPPFVGDRVEVMRAHVREAPPRPTSVRKELQRPMDLALYRGLLKEPEKRWQNASQMAGALLEALAIAPGAREAPPLTADPGSAASTKGNRAPTPAEIAADAARRVEGKVSKATTRQQALVNFQDLQEPPEPEEPGASTSVRPPPGAASANRIPDAEPSGGAPAPTPAPGSAPKAGQVISLEASEEELEERAGQRTSQLQRSVSSVSMSQVQQAKNDENRRRLVNLAGVFGLMVLLLAGAVKLVQALR